MSWLLPRAGSSHWARHVTCAGPSAMKSLRDLLYSSLRFVGRHVEGYYGALGVFVTAGFVLSLAAVSIFAAIASAVTAGFTQHFDEIVLQWFAAHRAPFLD